VVVGAKRRKIAAISIWLQLGAFGYLFVWDQLACSGWSCHPWALDTGPTWIVLNVLFFGLPIGLGILVWRGSLVAAILAIVGSALEIIVGGLFALIFLYGAGWGFYPFWVVAVHPFVLPGELAIVSLVLVVIAVRPATRPNALAAAGRN
jgi:hypothetical protein